MKLTDSVFSLCFMHCIILLNFVNPTAATCCPCDIYGTCGDTSGCVVWECCSTASCNILCCNCDGPCKGGKSSDLSNEKTTQLCMNKFTALDENQDGLISFLEWVQSRDAFASLSLEVLAQRWNQYDLEGKGYLTMDEAMNRRTASLSPKSNEGVTMVQQPFNYPHQIQQVYKPDGLTVGIWDFYWYSDNECKTNKQQTAGTGAKGCTEISAASSIGFEATSGFTLNVYAQKDCSGVPKTFNAGTDCTSFNIKMLAYKVVG